MQFSVGYQANEPLKKSILRHTDVIRELYFPWGSFPTGRGVFTGFEMQKQLQTDLGDYKEAGLFLNWLLNGNCFGRYAQSRILFQEIGDQAQELISRFGLNSVTTTSPLIARFLKNNFSKLEIRASVNMEIGTPDGIEYLLPWFDGFYLKREYNYDLVRLKQMRKFTIDHGKKLYLLANSGCLNYCSARTFHDNLVAHQHEIAEMDNALDFHGVCHLFLNDPNNRIHLLEHTNFIRPEDVAEFEPYCDGMKLATRTNRNPMDITESYAAASWHGNILDLTEPSFSGHFYPEILANDRIPARWLKHRLHCRKNCDCCDCCARIQKQATLVLQPSQTTITETAE